MGLPWTTSVLDHPRPRTRAGGRRGAVLGRGRARESGGGVGGGPHASDS